MTYHYFYLPFLSPLINMFILEPDYIDLLRHLREKMEEPLQFLREEWESGVKIKYPVYSMGGIELWMNHYSDFDLAKKKFEERRERINWDNLLVMLHTQDPKIAEAFEELPFKKKVCLTNFETDLPSSLYLKICEHPIFKGRETWRYVTGIASGAYVYYDPWEMLMKGIPNADWIEGVRV